jgi:arsenite methyltransferase
MDNENLTPGEGDIRVGVRRHYGSMAAQFKPESRTSCCPGESSGVIPLASLIYETEDVGTLPVDVTGLSAGCGDPITLASLQPGETVLDLGSGGGIDCFLAAKQVGEKGYVIGVDMTAEMVEKARANKAKLSTENVEFRLGEIEHLPVADATIDVIISNCVINLSPDKPQVMHEAFRVLKPGGRIAISDMVSDGPLPIEIQEDLASWVGCIAGALDYLDYKGILAEVGFVDIEIVPVSIQAKGSDSKVEKDACCCEPKVGDGAEKEAYLMIEGEVSVLDLGDANHPFSARITARKPAV